MTAKKSTPARKRTARAIVLTSESLQAQWDALFDAHPWLEGLSCDNYCEDVFCCPPSHMPDEGWDVISEVSGLLFLATGSSHVPTLHRSLVAVAGEDGAS